VSVRSPEFAHADYERFLPLALGREIAEWQSLELPPYRFLRHAARELIEEYLAPVDDVAVQPVPSADRDVVADVRAGAAAAPKVTSQQLTAAQYFERGSQEPDPEQAIVDYTRALEADPDYIVAQINRGIEYQRLGQFESAVADLTSVIEANPDYQNGLVWRAEALLELGEFEAAIEDLDRAIDLQHADGYAIYLRGRARLGHGQFEAAFTDYTRAIELGYDD
jgi:tetratricopeptide (TPR) repeat protein